MDPNIRRALTMAANALSSTFDYLHSYEKANAIRFLSGEVRESPLTELVRKALVDVETVLAEALYAENGGRS